MSTHFYKITNVKTGLIRVVFNTLRPRQNGRHFADDILSAFSWMKMFEFSLKFFPQGPINNIPASVQIMVWRPPGDKLLSEPMIFSLTTHICVTRPQWVKISHYQGAWFYYALFYYGHIMSSPWIHMAYFRNSFGLLHWRQGNIILKNAEVRTAHYIDVTMTTVASQITRLTIVYLAVYSDAD